MAKPKPVRIDDQCTLIDADAKLADVLPADVGSIVTCDGALIPRSEFARVPIPDGFETNLSNINKGGELAPARCRKGHRHRVWWTGREVFVEICGSRRRAGNAGTALAAMDVAISFLACMC